jgi:hypothetical protein
MTIEVKKRKGIIDTYYFKENYIIFLEYIKCVLPPLTEVMGLTINLISGTHKFYEKGVPFNVLPSIV